MNRRRFLAGTGVVATGLTAVAVATQTGGDDFDTVGVPGDEPTIQAGVDATREGDLVVVEPGTYGESVEITTRGITVRGADRNDVVVDGGFERVNGIETHVDGVAVENLTVRHFEHNGVYWSGVEGFRGSYLTAYNNGDYGIYAYGSQNGRFEYSYASGHADAGFYLGYHQPYEAVVSNVTAEYNAMGYSGSSTGADLRIEDSVWRNNMAGIVPNTLVENSDPQHSSTIVDNEVTGNSYADAPSVDHTYPTFGMGIALWGGSDNLVEDNVVTDHEHFGIVADHNVVEPSENRVLDNDVSGSGLADLALGVPAGANNVFDGNQFETSLPRNVEADASTGSNRVADVFETQQRRAEAGDVPGGSYRDQPKPDDQPSMPDPGAPPRPATKSVSWGE